MIITKIEKGETKAGDVMYYIHFADGKKYGWFDKPTVAEGDDVMCEFKAGANPKYTNLVSMKKIEQPSIEQVKVGHIGMSQIGTQSIEMIQKLKPHSYEFGKAGGRHKIYYESITDLQEHIERLQLADLIDPDIQVEESI